MLSITLTGNGSTTPLDPAALGRFNQIFLAAFRIEMRELASQVLDKLHSAYEVHDIHERVDGGPGLMERLAGAFESHIDAGPNHFEMGIFDLEEAFQGTSQEEYGDPEYPGFFALVEDGHTGEEHGSELYGFVTLEFALSKAEYLIASFNLDPDAAENFRNYVTTKFAGKYGTGIMVLIDRPLFFEFPQFGKASKHGIRPHPGYTAWNILRNMQQRTGKTLFTQAFENAMRRTRHQLEGK